MSIGRSGKKLPLEYSPSNAEIPLEKLLPGAPVKEYCVMRLRRTVPVIAVRMIMPSNAVEAGPGPTIEFPSTRNLERVEVLLVVLPRRCMASLLSRKILLLLTNWTMSVCRDVGFQR